MSHIIKTPTGTYRANWRDPTRRQRSKTFPTKREAKNYLAEIQDTLAKGSYVDPHAGKQQFGPYAIRWLESRNHERTTAARDASVMQTHVLARWGSVPLVRIDYLAAQTWVTELSKKLSASTVAACARLASSVMNAATRDKLIGLNPFDGVRLPRQRRKAGDDRVISMEELLGKLLMEIPHRYRALVAVAGGTGLRWGECIGLRWDAVDLEARSLRVIRVATEVAGHVEVKPYPKSKAGRRVVPLPDFVVEALAEHRESYDSGPVGEIFTNTAGGPLRRTLFRTRVWRPGLVRAGLLGKVTHVRREFLAVWHNKYGAEQVLRCATEQEAMAAIVKHAQGGLRFHDLRHSYATWLVSSNVPINDVQRVMGHEQASTTLDRYTHGSSLAHDRVLKVFADFSLIFGKVG